MDVTPLLSEQAKPVRSYGTGVFTVAGERYMGSVALTWDSVRLLPDLASAAALTADHASMLRTFIGEAVPDVLIIGTGRAYAEPSPTFLAALAEAGLPFPEMMDTGAACRTHNVLLAEGRALLSVLIAL